MNSELLSCVGDPWAGAVFSSCGKYRYKLWRMWDEDYPPLVFLMLNPSTADHLKTDPTVERCVRRAKSMGFGGVHVLNLFALRSTDPQALYKAKDPIGPSNDTAIEQVAYRRDVVCAWGNHGELGGRGLKVLIWIAGISSRYIFGLTQKNQPKHPLYVPYSLKPVGIDTGGHPEPVAHL